MRYTAGSAVTMSVEDYRNDAGVLVDPADVVLWYRKPDGTEETKPKADLTNPTTGTFEFTTAGDVPGDWVYAFTSTDPTIVIEGSFEVLPSVQDGDALQPGTGPCDPWCTVVQLTTGWDPPAGASDELLALCVDAASDLMFERSARRFPGICSDTVMPAPSAGCVLPMAEGGDVSLWPMARGSFLLDGAHEVDLGSYPVRQVVEVRIDGVALAQADHWRVKNWRRLVRIDGSAWPANTREGVNPPRLEVDFTFGEAPPPSGVLAALSLARELVKAMTPGTECALDRRVQSLSREGVTITIPGLVDTLRDGRTGIPEVDLFLWSHNPNGLQRRGRLLLLGGSAQRRTFP